jgi:protein TIF31
MDGATLSEALHNRGINIRYLGKIADSLSKIKQLEYLYNIAVAEILMRTVKHVFTVYMQVSMRVYCANDFSFGV